MGRKPSGVAAKGVVDCAAQGQLHGLNLGVQLAELRRQVEALLNQQVLDGVLKRALALRHRCRVKGFERVRAI